ncbi:MAG: hypothetical protein ACREAA_07240 [Candidatus Polarisedimenticolia bacterium]
MHIVVGIGARLLESADDGRSWSERARVVPPPTEPRLLGTRNANLPVPTGWTLTHVHIGANGIGLAAGHEPARGPGGRSSSARFLGTRDGGARWQPIQPDIGLWGRLRAGASWPPEGVDSVIVQADGLVAFAWEDPWLFDGPKCHAALSTDAGSHWRYVRLRDGCSWLVCGPGPLRISGAGRMAVRSGSGSFRLETLHVDWKLPPGYWQLPLPVRLMHFTSETEGLALVVSWPRDDSLRPGEDVPPPLVGLARSQDGGRHWKVVNTWEGPRSVDLNRRHELTLDVNV